MKLRNILWFLLTAAIGTALHFAYDLCPVPLVGLFAPVNESVWEHLKLLYWPLLATSIVRSFYHCEKERFWSGVLLAELLMPAVLLGIYYTLSAGFAVESEWLNIALYYLVLAAGMGIAVFIERSGKLQYLAGALVIPAGLYGAALILLTVAPPNLPIFIP